MILERYEVPFVSAGKDDKSSLYPPKYGESRCVLHQRVTDGLG